MITGMGDGKAPPLPDVLCVQEHRLNMPDDLRQAEDWSRKQSFHLAMDAAKRTSLAATATSGGTAAGCRKHIGMSRVHAKGLAAHTGRFTPILLNGVLPGGILVISAYFRDGVCHLDQLEALGLFLQGSKREWIVAADWNATPEEVDETTWPLRVGGTVVAPSIATCTAGSGRVIGELSAGKLGHEHRSSADRRAVSASSRHHDDHLRQASRPILSTAAL